MNAMVTTAELFCITLLCVAYSVTCLDWSPIMVAKYFSAKNVYLTDAIVCTEEDSLPPIKKRRKLRKCEEAQGTSTSATHKDRRFVFKYFTIMSRDDGYHGLFRTTKDLDYEQYTMEERLGVFIDISCPSNQQLIFNMTSSKWFTINVIWLIWDQDAILNDLAHLLPVSTFSNVAVSTSEEILQLTTATSILPLESHSVGRWDNSTRELTLQELNVRINFQNSPVRVAIMFIANIYNRSELHHQLQDDTYRPDGDVSNRFMFGNTLHLAYLYNFTLDIVIASNWGDRLENGTWTGMLGLLQQNEVDLTLSPMLALSRRLEISYPTVPTLPYWMAIIFKQPRALGTYRAMILELSLSAWACVGATFFAGAIVFALTQKYEPYQDASYDSEGFLAMGALQSIGIISSQGLAITPQGTSSRIVCLLLLLMGLILSNYYSAATMTALLSESPPLIKNLEQLIASNPPLTTLDTPHIRNKHARGRVFRSIIVDRLAMDNSFTIGSLDNGVNSLMNGSAFLGEYFVLFNAINNKLQSDTICDLTVFNAGFYADTTNLLKKCLHFRELHMRGILRTLEHGLMQKERNKWISQHTTCSRVTEFIYVQLEAVSVALGVFLLGVFLSMTLLFLELFMVKWSKIREIASDLKNQPTVRGIK